MDREDIKLDTNWLYMWSIFILQNLWNKVFGGMFGFLGVVFKEKIPFKNCNFKVLMSIYILCEMLSF